MNIIVLFMFTLWLPFFDAKTIKADVEKDDSQERDPPNEELSSLMIQFLKQKLSEKKQASGNQKSSGCNSGVASKATYEISKNFEDTQKAFKEKQSNYNEHDDDDDETEEADPMLFDQFADTDDSVSMESLPPSRTLRPIYPAMYPAVPPMVYSPIRMFGQPVHFPIRKAPIYNGFINPYQPARFVNL